MPSTLIIFCGKNIQSFTESTIKKYLAITKYDVCLKIYFTIHVFYKQAV